MCSRAKDTFKTKYDPQISEWIPVQRNNIQGLSIMSPMSCLSVWPDMLSLLSSVVSQEFQLEPLNITVLKGSDVQFNATVQGTWDVMTWHVGNFLVLTILASGGIAPSSEQFSARFCSSSDTRCVEFTIHNVTQEQSGPITCTVQGQYGSKTAQLSVQGK